MENESQNPYEAPREASQPEHGGGQGQPPPSSAFEAVNRRFFRLLGDAGGPLIILWAILALLGLPAQLLNVAAQESLTGGDMNQGLGLITIFYLLIVVTGALNVTSFRAMKKADETDGNITLMEAIDTTLSRVVATMATSIVYGLLVGIGALFCILPGVYLAIALMPAPFICAVYGYGPIESLKTARDWTHAHVTLVFLILGVGMLYGFFIMGVTMALTMFVFSDGMGALGAGTLGYIPTTMVWLLTSALGYFMWLYTGSVWITIGRAEEQFMRRYDLFEGNG